MLKLKFTYKLINFCNFIFKFFFLGHYNFPWFNNQTVNMLSRTFCSLIKMIDVVRYALNTKPFFILFAIQSAVVLRLIEGSFLQKINLNFTLFLSFIYY